MDIAPAANAASQRRQPRSALVRSAAALAAEYMKAGAEPAKTFATVPEFVSVIAAYALALSRLARRGIRAWRRLGLVDLELLDASRVGVHHFELDA